MKINGPLVLSTQLFLIPVFYAYTKELFDFMCVYFLMYISSSLYHSTNIKATHIVDLVTARSGCVVVFYMYYNCNTNDILPFLILHNIIVCYLKSCRIYYYEKSRTYIYYHMYFHFVSMLSWMYIVDDCKKCKLIKNITNSCD